MNKLLAQGIEIQQAPKGFTSGDVLYGPGSFVVSMAQPKMGVIRWLLGRTFYPDNSYTRDANGNPIRPYDMSTDTMAEFMGVRVDPVDEAVTGDLVKLTGDVVPVGKVARNANYVIDGRLNDSFKAVNLLLDKGVAVRRVDKPSDATLRPGDFIVTGGSDTVVADIARTTGVDFGALKGDPAQGTHAVKRLRIGMYQRFYGGNMDEGWTRWLLEQFDFPYKSLLDAEIKKGGLKDNYDVIILPSDSPDMIMGKVTVDPDDEPEGEYPPEYRSGIGKEGVDALQDFVKKGGTLLTFGSSGGFAIEHLHLPLKNVVAGRKPTEFWCPGSTLKVKFDSSNPLAYGMPAQGLAVFLAGNQAYEIMPTERNERVETVATFVDRDILQSGWLLGPEVIARKAAMVSVEQGQGKVILIGFRAQHRAQAHGTFKLVFNSLVDQPRSDTERQTAGGSR